jgi:hypothetical protein
MSDPRDRDHEQYFTDKANWTDISEKRVYPPPGRDVRHASMIIEGEPCSTPAKVGEEVTIRGKPKGRTLIKATFLEDDRSIRTLSLTKFNDRKNAEDRTSISLSEDEVTKLLEFARTIKTVELKTSGMVHTQGKVVEPQMLEDEARRLFKKNPALFSKLIESEPLAEDVVAVGYRRAQLDKFERLLSSEEDFAAEKLKLDCRAESVWQHFFEANTWIFGYGLSYQFLSSLDGKKLEQLVRGPSILAGGKRADAVAKTRGALSSLCFVEIKRHDTALLGSNSYRKDAWQPSEELTGGVAQLHATVQAIVEDIKDGFRPVDEGRNPTGEVLFNFAPRSFLVIGSLTQFQTEHGPNLSKFRSFELYRRHVWRPEIITFDELLERARFIVDAASST